MRMPAAAKEVLGPLERLHARCGDRVDFVDVSLRLRSRTRWEMALDRRRRGHAVFTSPPPWGSRRRRALRLLSLHRPASAATTLTLIFTKKSFPERWVVGARAGRGSWTAGAGSLLVSVDEVPRCAGVVGAVDPGDVVREGGGVEHAVACQHRLGLTGKAALLLPD